MIGQQADLTYPYEYLGGGPQTLAEVLDGKHSFAGVLKAAQRPMVIVGAAAAARSDGLAVLSAAARIALAAAGGRETAWNPFNVLHCAAGRVAGLDLGFVPDNGALDLVGLDVAYLLGAVFVTLVVAYNIYQASKKRKVYYSRALLIAALVWMKMPYLQWLAFVFIIMALLEYQAKYPLEIGFSDNEIRINALFKRKYNWNQFNNIMLKDGLLTMDFANNKLLQQEIEDEEEAEADEDEFNEYCKKNLKIS